MIAPDTPTPPSLTVPHWREQGRVHLDLRGLPPPRPLLEALRCLDSGLHDREGLVIHVPHIPVHLLPELPLRGWAWEVLSATEDGTAVLLHRETETAP